MHARRAPRTNATASSAYRAPGGPRLRVTTALPVADFLLDRHAACIGRDLPGYRNHVYRLINLVDLIEPIDPYSEEVVGIAAVFHDVGLWTECTWNYIPPSVAAAEHWLATAGLGVLIPVVRDIIENHHRILPCPAALDPLVEAFRRADWCDVTLGLRTGGIDRRSYREILGVFPSAGFHRRLAALAIRNACARPWRPFPMMRW